MPRARKAIEDEMEALVADARAAAAEDDRISYEVDHDKLNDLLSEYESVRRK